jgi:hypothetical protein
MITSLSLYHPPVLTTQGDFSVPIAPNRTHPLDFSLDHPFSSVMPSAVRTVPIHERDFHFDWYASQSASSLNYPDQPTLLRVGGLVKDVFGIFGRFNINCGMYYSVAHFDGLLLLDFSTPGIEFDQANITSTVTQTPWRFLAWQMKQIYGPNFETMVCYYEGEDVFDAIGDGSVIEVVHYLRIAPL